MRKMHDIILIQLRTVRYSLSFCGQVFLCGDITASSAFQEQEIELKQPNSIILDHYRKHQVAFVLVRYCRITTLFDIL